MATKVTEVKTPDSHTYFLPVLRQNNGGWNSRGQMYSSRDDAEKVIKEHSQDSDKGRILEIELPA